MTNVKIINGALVPHPSTVMNGLSQLLEQLRSDPRRAAAFRTNPRAVLGAHGFNEDIQNEVISEDAVLEVRDHCEETCVNTCIITSCTFTKCYLTI
jgi:hypothetical protein